MQSPVVKNKAPSSYVALGMRAEASPLEPGLYVVATPIGNLGDMSLRGLSSLAAADAILAEDTRVTKRLLAHYGITTPLERYDEHNAQAMRPRIVQRLIEGAALALVSDAGTPLISDPGFKLVTDVAAQDVKVIAIPGASALLAGLVVSGLPTDRFFFEGFLPPKAAARRRRIKELERIPGTLVFFEAPHRTIETLEDLHAVLGPRAAAVAREMTKTFETVRRGTLMELSAQFGAEPVPRGEIVILVAPPTEGAGEVLDLDARLRLVLATMSMKDAAAVVAAEAGLPKREVYARALQLAQQGRGHPAGTSEEDA